MNMITEFTKFHQMALISLDPNDSFNQRHLDNAHKAVSVEELDFVIENTTSRATQDYAIRKKYFFLESKK